MLESLVAWVLKHYLGRYVQNLNTDQLNIGIFSGEVNFSNLELKKEALRQVGLPIQVTAGYIGKVKVQIPITQIWSAPWVIVMEKIYLVAAPVNLHEWDEEAEEQAVLEQKLSVLDAIEAQWRSSTEGLDQGYYATSYTSWMNFGTSVVSSIVENLQLNISDVHIRYEDNQTFGDRYFSFGLTIESLLAHSCNENWERGLSSGEHSFKVLELNKLSMYWEDCEWGDFVGINEPDKFIESMEQIQSNVMQYLIQSVSGKVNMKKNQSVEPLRSRSTPRIICDIIFDQVPVTLSDKQYTQMVACYRSLQVLRRRIALKHIRPTCLVAEDPKKWWHYSYSAVVESSQGFGVKSWDVALKRAQDNVAYVRLYEKLLVNPAGALTEDEKSMKSRIESEQTLDELRSLRLAAMLRVRPGNTAGAAPSASYFSAWFPQFWYSSSSATGEPVDERKLYEELVEALENPIDDAVYLKRDVVFGQFNFSLKEGSVTLSSVKDNLISPMFELQLETLNLAFEWRPRNGSFKLSVALGAVFLKDKLTSQSTFPILIAPQSRELAPSNVETKKNLPAGIARLLNRSQSPRPCDESLLEIVFEVKPFDSSVDCRVNIKTQSLDIVYNPGAFNWLTEFFTKPQHKHGSSFRSAARRRYQALKDATRNEIIKNWEDILAGKLTNRKAWHIDLDISAPHFIFVEHFNDKNAVILVIDLGKLHFSNHGRQQPSLTKKESDEEETFATPCSTPPGSEASPDEVASIDMANHLNEVGLRAMLYEQYDVELGEMQVLVGRIKDSWKYAQLKGTSTLHVLDRFNISMQIERRVLYTTDPKYPSLTFCGKLPRLVVHVSEEKIAAIRTVYGTVVSNYSPSNTPQHVPDDLHPRDLPPAEQSVTSRLIIMQFTIQHLALEVQSRKRSVAELQVNGVRASLTHRSYDCSIALTVHSLLLVDAMQTFGRDFELLIASHKHVGMDSLSGSIRNSEPCSPTSPSSPEPGHVITSPISLSEALSELHGQPWRESATSPVFVNSPPHAHMRPPSPELPDGEALITVELNFISGQCPGADGQPQQSAAVQFNNLDLIANQETIVELIGFARRVFPTKKSMPNRPFAVPPSRTELNSPKDDPNENTTKLATTEATFDFHRLTILLMRAGVRNGVTVGKKICTATMLQAKIKATIAEELIVEGSLGGVQVLDVTPEGVRHQRILSLGADPLAPSDQFQNLTAGLYNAENGQLSEPAFSFSVKRALKTWDDQAHVKIRLASVWYTHSTGLIQELQSCATEFKQYLAKLARSIRSAATEVALGLVHARAEALAHSLTVSNRFSSSLYGGSIPDVSSPRKRRKSFTQSLENVVSTPQTPFGLRPAHTPWSPEDNEMLDSISIILDVVLDSPVIVLPKSPDSDQVFVAHLGTMTLNNSCKERETPWEPRVDSYHFSLKDMNIYSVTAAPFTDVSFSASGEAILPRPENMYSCADGSRILHDTVIDLKLEKFVEPMSCVRGSWDFNLDENMDQPVRYNLSGGLVDPLKLTLSRDQYRQIVATSQYIIESLGKVPPDLEVTAPQKLGNISEEEPEQTDTSFSLNMPKSSTGPSFVQAPQNPGLSFGINFQVPEFTVTLLGDLCVLKEGALVSISFRDFLLELDRSSDATSHLKMSLKSLVMQNLAVAEDSKSRFLVVSSAEPTAYNRRLALSQSCPTIPQCPLLLAEHNSLPENLTAFNFFKGYPERPTTSNPYRLQTANRDVPCTPPPSPRPDQRSSPTAMSRKENLVIITIDTKDAKTPNDISKEVTVDFNCLDVIADMASWVVVFDFFGVDGSPNNSSQSRKSHKNESFLSEDSVEQKSMRLEVEIKGLTLVLIRPEYDVCRASINYLSFNSLSNSEVTVEGRLGSMSLADLSPHGKMYRERFFTTGKEALRINYLRHSTKEGFRPCDSELSIAMSSVVYIHTQRFLNEIFAYFNRFSQLQTLMVSMRSDMDKPQLKSASRMRLTVNAGSPVIILPVSSSSTELLVAELGELSVSNKFRRAGSVETIAATAPEGTVNVRCLLDSMSIELFNMDLFAGKRVIEVDDAKECIYYGVLRIAKNEPALLPEKCRLTIQVDRNLDSHLSHEVPDLSIEGRLSKLEAFLDLSQYMVIRGLLSYNIGENLQDLVYATPEHDTIISDTNVWRTMSINFDLTNVVLHLREKHEEGANLACINFIRSRLVVDIFSDRSQDIDLVSAEILLTDTRFCAEPVNKRANVFTNILQPMGSRRNNRFSSGKPPMEKRGSHDSEDGAVQAEVHHRRRRDYSKTTILLHNMRVMAIIDWWEMVKDFIGQNFPDPGLMPGGAVKSAPPAQNVDASAYVTGLGVADKYPPMVDAETIPFEFKLNVTDSEIVIVEDTAAWDANAIILKSTTVISYRPGLLEKPLSCNLNHCEVFSCLLGMEDETALSIIDPVTINMEVALKTTGSEARGISDAVVSSDDRTLEVSLGTLNVRLSYHDFRMLSAMLESVPKQTRKARHSVAQRSSKPANFHNQIEKLAALGFNATDCTHALEHSNGQLDEAALWLTQNASHPLVSVSSSPVSFHAVEVKMGCLSIVVIDDCRDADVPLLELSMSQMSLKQVLGGEGTAKFLIATDYYNRVLSGWEPFIESWKCQLKWEQSLSSGLSRNRLQLDVASDDLVNINITSTLLELFKTVKNNWTEDYLDSNGFGRADKSSGSINVRRRSPFVPFAIRNETGCELWFTKLVKSANASVMDRTGPDDEWLHVAPDETLSFMFRERSRHRDTHKMTVHQIVVRSGIWQPVSPVSIDKVGIVFRNAAPMSHQMHEVPPARLVFAIALEGSARKLITVRSALTISNNLTEAVEAKLENTVSYPGVWDDTMCAQIQPNTSLSVPLSHAHSHIWIRPVDSVNLRRYHAFSSSPIGWMSVTNPGEQIFEAHQCNTNRDNSFRFLAGILHEDVLVEKGAWLQPAHVISLFSPLIITNLLPCDLHFSLRQNSARGHVKPGMTANIHEVDHEQRIEINFQLDAYPRHGTVSIPSPASSFRGEIRVHDDAQKRLILNIAVDVLDGAGIRISVSAPFWIINKTSLPLVFRQEGSQEAAGQGAEAEVARIVSPLLFSLADPDAGSMLQIRVGKSHLPDSQPQWCQPLSSQDGTKLLRLRIIHRDRPDVMYVLGMNIRSGKGRHRRTKIITLSPRFQLHNKSSYELQFAQHCLATTLNDPAASATYCKAVEECSLAWHWPRLDRELLLCLRILDVRDCLWSGGFAIDNGDSFHINVRDLNGKMYFLRAEIVLQGATYFTVITNADNMPPPVRVDNLAHVAIEFYQTDPKIETARTAVRAKSSVAYSWDIPKGSTKLAVVAPGGACAAYDVNLDINKSPVTLTYENFIYISFTATFNNVDDTAGSSRFEPMDVESQQLVLDCIDGRKVILNRKQPGKRSQLWCMTSDGQLQHEGSSPPRDPKSKSPRNNWATMVLDIAGTAPQPLQCVSLVLRRPDPRRSSTQTWRFTEDGRLCCVHSNMCVQAKDGFFGLRQGSSSGGKWQMWSEVALGPRCADLRGQGVPIEQAVSRMKMRPGSGCLFVSVSSDGPTRVLRVTDPIDSKAKTDEWVSTVHQEGDSINERELQLSLLLSHGIGVSVVSKEPSEELVYIHLRGIRLEIGRTPVQTKVDCSIEDLQCDNQLLEAACPVVLYVARQRDDDPKKNLPAIIFSAFKHHSLNVNAHIFKHFILTVKSLSLSIEELLFLKLSAMFLPSSDASTEDTEESDFEAQRRVMEATSVHAARYYFGYIRLTPDQIRLSVSPSQKLPDPLRKIKKKMGLRLIKFEDAIIELREFKRQHPFETSQCLWASVVKHFKNELTWQAGIILGTVDFLGNPLGLLTDVSEGVHGFLTEGDVVTLFQSVTHGLSNSAAKVTGSLSDGLGKVILDESHEETRQRIRNAHSGSSKDHLWAGMKSFGFGMFGGATSIFKQTYEGVAQDGFPGLISGLGKGLLGTLTKPVVGVLDFASETASAVRDSSRTSDRPQPLRQPRLVLGAGGLLPAYSTTQAEGQRILYEHNNRNYSERLVWYEELVKEEEIRAIISNEKVLVFTSDSCVVQALYHLSSIVLSQALAIEDQSTHNPIHYIELVLHFSGSSSQEFAKKGPRVRCDSRDIAERVCHQINHARTLYEESKYAVPCFPT